MPPVNDNLADSILLVGSNPTATGTTVGSTNEADEITVGLDYGAGDVWYIWQAPFTGNVKFTLNAVSMDGEFDVYLGNGSGNTFVNLNNNFLTYNSLSGGTGSTTQDVIAGNYYVIQVCYYTVSGDFDLEIIYNSIAVIPPNDNFTQAQSCTAVSFPINADNTYATTEIGEPTSHYNSLWYSFSSQLDGTLNLSLGGSFNINVYIGDELTELSPIIPLAGSGNNITIPIFSNINYKIVIYSTSSSSYGSFTLDGTFTPIDSPNNDYFANALPFSGTTFSQTTDNTLATTELFEDTTNYFSVWYSYRPDSILYFTLAQTSGIPLNFKVYNGTSIQNITQLASSNDSIGIVMVKDVTYYIAVSSQSSASYGKFTVGGGVVSELPFSYIGPTTPSLSYNGNGSNSIVVDSNGTIFLLKQDPLSVYRSSDGGNTWTLDRAFPTLSSSNTYGGNSSMYLDENGNIVVVYLIFVNANNNNSYIPGASVRNKNTTSWTDYTGAQIDSMSNLGTWGITWTFCQDDTGMLHFSLNYARQSFGNFIQGASIDIMYCNFKDGSFSTPTPITQYSNGNSTGSLSLQLVNWNGVYLFWRTSPYNGGSSTNNGTLNYCQINPSSPLIMDVLNSTTAWATAKNYYVGDLVTESSSIYKCLVNNLSGVFSTDLGNGKWQLVSSYATPTPVPALVNQDVYNVKSDGTNIYFYSANGNSLNTTTLYKNFSDISSTSSWVSWLTLKYFEIAMNGDMVVYGVDNRVFGGEPSVVARIGGVWQPEHTGPNNTFVGGHTYNFAIIR